MQGYVFGRLYFYFFFILSGKSLRFARPAGYLLKIAALPRQQQATAVLSHRAETCFYAESHGILHAIFTDWHLFTAVADVIPGNVIACNTNVITGTGNVIARNTNVITYTENVAARNTNVIVHAENVIACNTNVDAHTGNVIARNTNVITGAENVIARNMNVIACTGNVAARNGSADRNCKDENNIFKRIKRAQNKLYL